MTIRTFWILLLKILGIWLILSGLTVIPQFLSFFTFLGDNQLDNLIGIIYILVLILLTIGLYFVVLKLFVFNSTWIIDKLKLDKGFPEETINLNVTMGLTIATIVIGGLIFVDALPMLCKQIFTFFQQKTVFSEDPQFGWMIFYFVKTMIGYLLMTNSRYVVGYIHKNADDNQA